ncbi:MAG: ATP-binding protein [Caldilineaceae bacterium]
MRSYFARHFTPGDTDSRPFLARYGMVVVCTAGAYILTQLLPAVHQFTPFLFYILAVLAVTVYGGVGPGVLAAVCAVLIVPGWTPSEGGMLPLSTPYLFHTAAFSLIASIILLLSYALGATRGRLANARAQSAAQQRYQQILLDHISDGIYVLDRELRILVWSRGAEELYGWTAQETVGRLATEIVRTHVTPEQRMAILAAVDAGERGRYQVIHTTKAGDTIYVDSTTTALRGPDGEPVGYVVINRDMTAMVSHEQELVALSASLEQRVRERTAELERSNRELDQFAYVASHDLKAPLRSIGLLAQWISEDSAEVLSPKSLEHLEKLNRRVRRMEQLLDDLLAYSRAGRVRQPPEQVDTGAMVQETVDLLNLPPGFVVTLPPVMPMLITERVPLATVFRNLIQNAYKHHNHPEHGCITITADDLGQNPGMEEDTMVQFSVTDDGPGIASEYQEQVFELFRTLKPRDQVEGSGMGLSIVKKTVESRGGTIHLASAPGAGATFTFTWPKHS